MSCMYVCNIMCLNGKYIHICYIRTYIYPKSNKERQNMKEEKVIFKAMNHQAISFHADPNWGNGFGKEILQINN